MINLLPPAAIRVACLIGLGASAWLAPRACGDDRPNVIVVLADDLGFSDLGCYGSSIPTPNLDALAETGARFSAFYTSARCCPSRASLMTGLHPHQAGIGSFATRQPRKAWGPAYTGHLLPDCVTLAEVLGDAGYSTWMVGKWHMGIPGPIERGFQHYFGYKNYLAYAEDQWDPESYVRLPEDEPAELDVDEDGFYATDVFNDYALEFLKQARSDDRPYFLYLAHSSPHFPVQAPEDSIDRHMDLFRQGWDELREERLAKQKSLELFDESVTLPPLSLVPVDDEEITNGYGGQPNPPWDSLDADRQEDLARRGATFAAMVEHVDRGIGKIVEDLRAHDELDNTLLIFLSDNGACYEWGPFGFDGPSRQGITKLHTGDELARFGQAGTYSAYGSGWANLGNTPLNMYKHFCHEGGIASPLLIHWPAGTEASGDWVHTPAHLMDVMPTVLEATGAVYPDTRDDIDITPVEGVSVLPMIAGEETAQRALAFEHQEARGLRRGKWKLTWGKRQPDEVTWELFDLEIDRSEQNDLSEQYPELTAELTTLWEDWAKRVGAAPFQEPSQAEDADGGNDDSSGQASPESDTTDDGSPRIKNRTITINAQVRSDLPKGVVVAQGGREHGYAVHFDLGRPIFDVRIGGKVTRLSGRQVVIGRIDLTATLDQDEMSLSVLGGENLTAKSPGLIPVDPQDAISIGLDVRTAAGDYEAPHPFVGRVIDVDVSTGKTD